VAFLEKGKAKPFLPFVTPCKRRFAMGNLKPIVTVMVPGKHLLSGCQSPFYLMLHTKDVQLWRSALFATTKEQMFAYDCNSP